MKKRSFLIPFLIPSIFFLFFGCAGKEKEIKTIKGDPELLYKQGLVQFNKRNYTEALKIFEQIKSTFPDSPPYSLWAELKIGDCHFFKEEYVEAIAAYEEFKKAHPTHEEIPYVYYQIGMAYFLQMRSEDRDQTNTRKALSTFEYLIHNFPPSLFTEKAQEKVRVCRRQLAEHEFYIGNFYYKGRKYQAAAARFEGLLEKFPDKDGQDRTLYLLGKCYLELHQPEKAREAFQKIVEGYPKSAYFKEAKAILDQGVQEKKPSPRTKSIEPKQKVEEIKGPFLIRFEEEGRRLLSFREERQDRSPQLPPVEGELKPEEEKRALLLPKASVEREEMKSQGDSFMDREAPKIEESIKETKEGKSPREKVLKKTERVEAQDFEHPIDITSDRVEGYLKENLIVFKGNVIARQKEIVLYCDALEAILGEDGKGIERVIASGNVKIQQGARVASSEKAIFYNREQKIILTGNPKISEDENLVSGEEILVDLEKNRVEVKGGSDKRGKVKVIPKEESEKPR